MVYRYINRIQGIFNEEKRAIRFGNYKPGLCPRERPAQTAEPYTWKSVQMVGGGFVDGIIFHPTAKGVRYARTDIGGAYRWDDKAKEWIPLLDWAGWKDINLMGVESIALDPSDSNRLYMACAHVHELNDPPTAQSCVQAIAAKPFSVPTCHSKWAETKTAAATANVWQ